MFERLLTALIIVFMICFLAWNAMCLSTDNKTLRRENNRLGLHIARVDRTMPKLKILYESLTELEKIELNAEVGRFK